MTEISGFSLRSLSRNDKVFIKFRLDEHCTMNNRWRHDLTITSISLVLIKFLAAFVSFLIRCSITWMSLHNGNLYDVSINITLVSFPDIFIDDHVFGKMQLAQKWTSSSVLPQPSSPYNSTESPGDRALGNPLKKFLSRPSSAWIAPNLAKS